MNSHFTRRRFLGTSAAAGVGLGLGVSGASNAKAQAGPGKPAILGGTKTHTGAFPSWPQFNTQDDQALLQALHSGKWGRLIGQNVAGFEKAFSTICKAKHCVATSSGTTALLTTLGALGTG